MTDEMVFHRALIRLITLGKEEGEVKLGQTISWLSS
jgi:hypothetical protein